MSIGQHGKGREAIKIPGEFTNFGYPALPIEYIAFNIKPKGKPRSSNSLNIFFSLSGTAQEVLIIICAWARDGTKIRIAAIVLKILKKAIVLPFIQQCGNLVNKAYVINISKVQ